VHDAISASGENRSAKFAVASQNWSACFVAERILCSGIAKRPSGGIAPGEDRGRNAGRGRIRFDQCRRIAVFEGKERVPVLRGFLRVVRDVGGTVRWQSDSCGTQTLGKRPFGRVCRVEPPKSFASASRRGASRSGNPGHPFAKARDVGRRGEGASAAGAAKLRPHRALSLRRPAQTFLAKNVEKSSFLHSSLSFGANGRNGLRVEGANPVRTHSFLVLPSIGSGPAGSSTAAV